MAETFEERAARLAQMDVRALVGLALSEALPEHPELVALYADVGRRFDLGDFSLGGGTTLDVGIAEQDMIGVAAGLCHEGFRPVAISYAPFVTGRVFDQIKANMGAMGLPIVLIGSASGLSKGDLGPLLMCVDDVAMLRTIPQMTVMTPADGVETVESILAALRAKRPAYIRLTGGKTLPGIYAQPYAFEIGHAVELRHGQRIVVIATGAVVSRALAAANRLAAEGVSVAVLNMHTVKPLDAEALERHMDAACFVTVEEHSACGGLGGAVAEVLAQRGTHPRLISLGTPENYFDADRYESLIAKAGLSAEALYETLKSLA